MHKVTSFDPPIRVYKTQAMFYMLDLINKGYKFWMAGEIDANKAAKFATKMAQKYGVHLSETGRYKRKKQGQCNSYLVMHPRADSKAILWWIFATEGQGDIKQHERLKDALSKKKSHRLTWQDQFEVVRSTKFFKREEAKAVGITWRLQKEARESAKDRIKRACQNKNSYKISQALGSFVRMPGFRGIRSDFHHLMKHYREQSKAFYGMCWKELAPAPPEQIGWVRRKTADVKPLSVLCRQMAIGRPWR